MASEEAAPLVEIGPEGSSRLGVEDCEVCSACRVGVEVVGNGVFMDLTGIDGAGLAARVEDVVASWRRSGQHENEVGLRLVSDDLETAPGFESSQGFFANVRYAGLVIEEYEFGGADWWRDFLRGRRSFRERSVSLRCDSDGNDQEN